MEIKDLINELKEMEQTANGEVGGIKRHDLDEYKKGYMQAINWLKYWAEEKEYKEKLKLWELLHRKEL